MVLLLDVKIFIGNDRLQTHGIKNCTRTDSLDYLSESIYRNIYYYLVKGPLLCSDFCNCGKLDEKSWLNEGITLFNSLKYCYGQRIPILHSSAIIYFCTFKITKIKNDNI